MREIYLFDPVSEARLRQRGRTKKDMKNDISMINKVYKLTKSNTRKETKRFIDFIERAFANPSYMNMMMGYGIPYRLYDGDIKREMPVVSFMYFMILVTPLVEKGIVLDESYIFDPKPFRVRELEEYIDKNYITRNRDKFTYEEMCEEICFVREMFDMIAERLGERLMQNLSMYDFINLMDNSKEARDIMMVNYDFPNNVSPREIEELANKKTEELVDIIKTFKGSALESALSSGVVNVGQFKELCVLIGNKPDLYGNTIPLTSPTNNLKGFTDPAAYWVDAASGIKAETIKLNVADAGSFERSLTLLASDLRYVDLEYVCDSKHYLEKEITSIKQLKMFEGRFYILDPEDEDEEFKIISGKEKNLLNKKIYLKTPITCTHKDYHKGVLCRGCYTEMLAVGNQRLHIGMNSAYAASDYIWSMIF